MNLEELAEIKTKNPILYETLTELVKACSRDNISLHRAINEAVMGTVPTLNGKLTHGELLNVLKKWNHRREVDAVKYEKNNGTISDSEL